MMVTKCLALGCIDVISLIPWTAVVKELEQLIPGCRILLPDSIAESAKQTGCAVNFAPLCEWEGMTDQAILNMLLPREMPTDAAMVIVTDAAFNRSASLLRQADLDEFPSWHFAKFGEGVVSGDVIILIPSRRTIALFHHSGFHARIELP